MKVLFYNHTGQVSGAERLLLMILERLDRRGFLPLALCPGNGPLLQMLTDLDVAAATVEGLDARFTLRGDHLLRYLRSVYRVARELRRKITALKPDLIHANSIRAGLVATVATTGLEIRVVWHLHDLLPRHPLSSAIRIFALLSTRTRMVAVSQAVADNFVGSFFGLKNRVSVVLNAIDLKRFQTAQTSRHSIREELLLSDARPLIGIVGQLTPRKRQLELIRAFAKFLKEMPQAMLVVVGAPLFNRDEEYAGQLKKTVQDLGIGDRVRITGARNDVAAVMQSLDLLVVNSTVEPFGLVVLEAMACGTPVLAAASGGVSEIIDHGRSGWLIPPGNEQELINSLLKLAGDPDLLSRLAEQGRTRVASRFSVDRYLTDLMEFYGSGGELGSSVVDHHSRSSKDRNLHERARLELS